MRCWWRIVNFIKLLSASSILFLCVIAAQNGCDDDPYDLKKQAFYRLLDDLDQGYKKKSQLSNCDCQSCQGNAGSRNLGADGTVSQISKNNGFEEQPHQNQQMESVAHLPGTSDYYKQQGKRLDGQLIDEVLEQAPPEIEEVIDTINDSVNDASIRIILSGPPGVGKTTIAKAIAQQTGRDYVVIRGTALANQYQFSGQQNLAQAIAPLIQKNEPCIVIIDELDALKQTHGNKDNVDADAAGTLCTLVDDCEDNPNMIFIATTNKLKQIPDDLKSRFTVVEVNLPDAYKREMILWHYLGPQKTFTLDDSVDDVFNTSFAKKTNKFSARELKAIVTQARSFGRKRDFSDIVITPADLVAAYKVIRPHLASNKDRWSVQTKEFLKNNWYNVVSLGLTAVNMGIGEWHYERSFRQTQRHNEAGLTQSERHFRENIEQTKSQGRWSRFSTQCTVAGTLGTGAGVGIGALIAQGAAGAAIGGPIGAGVAVVGVLGFHLIKNWGSESEN